MEQVLPHAQFALGLHAEKGDEGRAALVQQAAGVAVQVQPEVNDACGGGRTISLNAGLQASQPAGAMYVQGGSVRCFSTTADQEAAKRSASP